MNIQQNPSPLALIVEDQALLVMATEDLLIRLGFDVICAYTEDEVRTVSTARLSVAVIGLKLDGQYKGLRVIEYLRLGRPNLPIVVVTGYDSSGLPGGLRDLRGVGGPTVRLMKPTDQNELSAAVKYVVERDRNGTPPQSGRRKGDINQVAAPAAVPKEEGLSRASSLQDGPTAKF